KHLAAIAQEAGCDVDVYALFEKYADTIPLLTAVRPNGETSTEAFEAAGGARAVLKQLERFLFKTARSVDGATLGESLSEYAGANPEVSRPVERPLGRHATIVMLRGTLAPQTGIVKLSVTERRKLQLRGPAVVYETTQAAMDGVARGEVKEGDVVVLRGLGPKGTPGMGMATSLVFSLLGAGLARRVAVVTDGQLAGPGHRG